MINHDEKIFQKIDQPQYLYNILSIILSTTYNVTSLKLNMKT